MKEEWRYYFHKSNKASGKKFLMAKRVLNLHSSFEIFCK